MLAIPKPASSKLSSVIRLEESEQAIERCLSLIVNRPLPPNSFSTLSSLEECATFFNKHDMPGGLSFLHIILNRSAELLDNEPLAVYNFACRFD